MTLPVLLLGILTILAIGTVLSNPTTSSQKHSKNDGHNHTVRANASGNEADEVADADWEYENTTIVDTRRILYSKRVSIGKRPYMVYLQLTKESAKAHKYRGWLCGGVIVHPHYVLTSAACVEDADHFYIVSGTTKYVDSFDYKTDECVCKHRRKVVWKCIPKNYKFDFQDSIKWSANDIAIVRVDRPFKLGVLEKGCEFATDLVCYNNVSRELEKAGTKGFIAGWGSGNQFREGVYRRDNVHIAENSKYLQEAKVCIMDNEQCAKKWAQRFRNIITQYMICTKDVMKRLSEICDKKYANCTDVESRRHDEDPTDLQSVHVDLGRHLRDPDDYTARRSNNKGGFCENDHGGPLLVKYQGKERVVGVISACKIDPKTHSCHGPFLYTSVFKNRQFLSCSINKDVELTLCDDYILSRENCRRVFRSGITHEEWDVNWDNVEEDDDNRADNDDDKDALREESSKKSKNKEVSSESSDGDEQAKEKNKKQEGREKSEKGKSKSKKSKRGKDKRHAKSDTQIKGAVSYESSRDDNVNEPDE